MTHLNTAPSIRPFLFIIGLLFLIASFTSCRRDNLFGIRGEGAAITESRTLAAFDGVDVSIDAEVILHTDSVYHVEISAQPNVLDVISTRVKGSSLCIGFSREVWKHDGITVHVYAPTYVETNLSGSGSISSADSLNVNGFKINVSGSGKVTVSNLQAVHVTANISGSGDVQLNGAAQLLESDISGSGELNAFGLPVLTGEAAISGSGNMEINATQSITGSISGSGTIYYKNNPAVTVSVSGSGRLVHVQ
jgi:hypothetical protein